ncbi:hypothetical protein, partial [Paenibacillus ehimensis]|uniref:hypothetical protein n=1 Tax=Paenibacillus ehimensis TaxID=79264 RepID=UPI001C3F8FC8
QPHRGLFFYSTPTKRSSLPKKATAPFFIESLGDYEIFKGLADLFAKLAPATPGGTAGIKDYALIYSVQFFIGVYFS